MRSTPTSAMETLLMLPPLGIFIEMESIQAVYRLEYIGRFNQARVGHSKVFTKMTEENPLLFAPFENIEPTNVFGRKVSVEFPSRIEWLDPVSILPPNGVIFYTDGSLLHRQTGAGVYSESLEIGDAHALGSNSI
jgi:hypothetical protein